MRSFMHFTPPPIIDKSIKQSIDLSKIDLNNPETQKYIKKYREKYRKLEEQQAQKMAKEIADEKRKKRSEFFLDIFKAIIVAVATLGIEHFMDIVRFIQNLFLQE